MRVPDDIVRREAINIKTAANLLQDKLCCERPIVLTITIALLLIFM